MKMTTLSTQYSSPELTQHLFCIDASSPTGIDGVSTGKIDFIESEGHYTI